jgi:hypothetical protein
MLGRTALPKRSELSWVAFASLVFTYAFFFEYLPPFKVVHIPYDLDGYHYPLLDYAFRSLRQGIFPQWDATIYCGITLIGNPQVGLFYPPTWLLFAVNAGQERLQYWTLEVLVILHVWLAFLLCYVWLRSRGLAKLSSTFGAGAFAFSGYLLLQLQHFGLACGYAWMPLGLWSIDQAASSGHWRPLWKLVLASTMCFLAGYTPTWFVFCVAMAAYALGSRRTLRTTLATAAALALSVLIVMVQLLPAREAASMKIPEFRYGSGIKNLVFYSSYIVPNYFDFAMDAPLVRVGEYLYLGAPVFLGVAYALRRRRFREHLPIFVMLAVVLVLLTNPFSLVWNTVKHSRLLAEICRDWYFLAAVTLGIVPIAAWGLDSFLSRPVKPAPKWLMPVAIGALALWSGRLLRIWWPEGAEFRAGWASALDPAVFVPLFGASMLLLRGETGRRRVWLTAALVLAAGVEYKAFGTCKRFNARPGKYDKEFRTGFAGLNEDVYAEVRSYPEFRIAVDSLGPSVTALRHHGLRTPQGFDPMLPAQYTDKLKEFMRESDHRMFDLDAGREELLRSLGVRFFFTADEAAMRAKLASNENYRLIEPANTYFKVYELRDSRPSFRWEPRGHPNPAPVERTRWLPSDREFRVRSPAGGRFVLVEQFYPGWRATIDGVEAAIYRHDDVFQAVDVPGGEHTIRFEFRSRGLQAGALLTLAGLAGMCIALAWKRPFYNGFGTARRSFDVPHPS